MIYGILGTLILLVSTGFIVMTFDATREMVAPGELIPAHAELSDDCFACHTPLVGASPAKCTGCHQADQIGRLTTTGMPVTNPAPVPFHQQLQDDDCMACHTDHDGIRLTRHRIRPFTHTMLVPQTAAQCSGCHETPSDTFYRSITDGCADCHRTDHWTPVSFNHDQFFRLDRDHDVECTTCHIGNVHREYTCYGCHEHTQANIRRRHEREGIRDFEDYASCHTSPHGHPRGEDD